LRQPRNRLLHLVLHLDLRNIRIDALFEGGRNAHLPARAGIRAEIEQPVDPGQLLLDDLGGGEEDSATGSASVDRQPLPPLSTVGELPDFDALVASALAERVPSESPRRDPDAQP